MPEPKWDLKEDFWCFHISVLIFTGKGRESFYISCFYVASALFCTQLILFLGLLKISMWFNPEMVILGGGRFISLNDKNTELFRGYKIGSATEKPQGFLFSNCTVEGRPFFIFFWWSF